MRRSPSRGRVQPVLSETDYDAEPDAYFEILVPDDEYLVRWVSEERKVYFRRETWQVLFEFADGEYVGKPLVWFCRVPERDPKKRPGPTSAFFRAYAAATGLRPPKHLATLRPRDFLGDCVLRVRTRVVDRDSHGNERPETASYSRIDSFLGRVPGSGAPAEIQRRIQIGRPHAEVTVALHESR